MKLRFFLSMSIAILSLTAQANFEKRLSVWDSGSDNYNIEFEESTETDYGKQRIRDYFLKDAKRQKQGELVTSFFNSTHTKSKIDYIKTYTENVIASSVHFKNKPERVEELLKKISNVVLKVHVSNAGSAGSLLLFLDTNSGKFPNFDTNKSTEAMTSFSSTSGYALDLLLLNAVDDIKTQIREEVQDYDLEEIGRINREVARERLNLRDFSRLDVDDTDRGTRKEIKENGEKPAVRSRSAVQDA